MAFKKKENIFYIGLLIATAIALPFVATQNIDCKGKAFHCVNSTHFKICVDLGGGVSTTVDDFLIPCPQSTVCKNSNYFECEYQVAIFDSTLPSEVTNDHIFETPLETLDVISSFNNASDVQLSDVIISTTPSWDVNYTELPIDSFNVSKNISVTSESALYNLNTTIHGLTDVADLLSTTTEKVKLDSNKLNFNEHTNYTLNSLSSGNITIDINETIVSFDTFLTSDVTEGYTKTNFQHDTQSNNSLTNHDGNHKKVVQDPVLDSINNTINISSAAVVNNSASFNILNKSVTGNETGLSYRDEVTEANTIAIDTLPTVTDDLFSSLNQNKIIDDTSIDKKTNMNHDNVKLSTTVANDFIFEITTEIPLVVGDFFENRIKDTESNTELSKITQQNDPYDKNIFHREADNTFITSDNPNTFVDILSTMTEDQISSLNKRANMGDAAVGELTYTKNLQEKVSTTLPNDSVLEIATQKSIVVYDFNTNNKDTDTSSKSNNTTQPMPFDENIFYDKSNSTASVTDAPSTILMFSTKQMTTDNKDTIIDMLSTITQDQVSALNKQEIIIDTVTDVINNKKYRTTLPSNITFETTTEKFVKVDDVFENSIKNSEVTTKLNNKTQHVPFGEDIFNHKTDNILPFIETQSNISTDKITTGYIYSTVDTLSTVTEDHVSTLIKQESTGNITTDGITNIKHRQDNLPTTLSKNVELTVTTETYVVVDDFFENPIRNTQINTKINNITQHTPFGENILHHKIDNTVSFKDTQSNNSIKKVTTDYNYTKVDTLSAMVEDQIGSLIKQENLNNTATDVIINNKQYQKITTTVPKAFTYEIITRKSEVGEHLFETNNKEIKIVKKIDNIIQNNMSNSENVSDRKTDNLLSFIEIRSNFSTEKLSSDYNDSIVDTLSTLTEDQFSSTHIANIDNVTIHENTNVNDNHEKFSTTPINVFLFEVTTERPVVAGAGFEDSGLNATLINITQNDASYGKNILHRETDNEGSFTETQNNFSTKNYHVDTLSTTTEEQVSVLKKEGNKGDMATDRITTIKLRQENLSTMLPNTVKLEIITEKNVVVDDFYKNHFKDIEIETISNITQYDNLYPKTNHLDSFTENKNFIITEKTTTGYDGDVYVNRNVYSLYGSAEKSNNKENISRIEESSFPNVPGLFNISDSQLPNFSTEKNNSQNNVIYNVINITTINENLENEYKTPLYEHSISTTQIGLVVETRTNNLQSSTESSIPAHFSHLTNPGEDFYKINEEKFVQFEKQSKLMQVEKPYIEGRDSHIDIVKHDTDEIKNSNTVSLNVESIHNFASGIELILLANSSQKHKILDVNVSNKGDNLINSVATSTPTAAYFTLTDSNSNIAALNNIESSKLKLIEENVNNMTVTTDSNLNVLDDITTKQIKNLNTDNNYNNTTILVRDKKKLSDILEINVTPNLTKTEDIVARLPVPNNNVKQEEDIHYNKKNMGMILKTKTDDKQIMLAADFIANPLNVAEKGNRIIQTQSAEVKELHTNSTNILVFNNTNVSSENHKPDKILTISDFVINNYTSDDSAIQNEIRMETRNRTNVKDGPPIKASEKLIVNVNNRSVIDLMNPSVTEQSIKGNKYALNMPVETFKGENEKPLIIADKEINKAISQLITPVINKVDVVNVTEKVKYLNLNSEAKNNIKNYTAGVGFTNNNNGNYVTQIVDEQFIKDTKMEVSHINTTTVKYSEEKEHNIISEINIESNISNIKTKSNIEVDKLSLKENISAEYINSTKKNDKNMPMVDNSTVQNRIPSVPNMTLQRIDMKMQGPYNDMSVKENDDEFREKNIKADLLLPRYDNNTFNKVNILLKSTTLAIKSVGTNGDNCTNTEEDKFKLNADANKEDVNIVTINGIITQIDTRVTKTNVNMTNQSDNIIKDIVAVTGPNNLNSSKINNVQMINSTKVGQLNIAEAPILSYKINRANNITQNDNNYKFNEGGNTKLKLDNAATNYNFSEKLSGGSNQVHFTKDKVINVNLSQIHNITKNIETDNMNDKMYTNSGDTFAKFKDEKNLKISDGNYEYSHMLDTNYSKVNITLKNIYVATDNAKMNSDTELSENITNILHTNINLKYTIPKNTQVNTMPGINIIKVLNINKTKFNTSLPHNQMPDIPSVENVSNMNVPIKENLSISHGNLQANIMEGDTKSVKINYSRLSTTKNISKTNINLSNSTQPISVNTRINKEATANNENKFDNSRIAIEDKTNVKAIIHTNGVNISSGDSFGTSNSKLISNLKIRESTNSKIRVNSELPLFDKVIMNDVRVLNGSISKLNNNSKLDYTYINLSQIHSKILLKEYKPFNSEIDSEFNGNSSGVLQENVKLISNKGPIEIIDYVAKTKINNGGSENINNKYLEMPIRNETHSTQESPKAENKVQSTTFTCDTGSRGKYADKNDCNKFYICTGKLTPVIGRCPVDTVFSEINKQCTKKLSHCIRNNQFKCLAEGRFADVFSNNFYYICAKNSKGFVRFKLKCQEGYHLNPETIHCILKSTSGEDDSKNISDISTKEKPSSEDIKPKKEFPCKKEGLFEFPDDCRKYVLCTKKSKSEFRRKVKKCDSDEVFDKDKKKCVDEESHECKF